MPWWQGTHLTWVGKWLLTFSIEEVTGCASHTYTAYEYTVCCFVPRSEIFKIPVAVRLNFFCHPYGNVRNWSEGQFKSMFRKRDQKGIKNPELHSVVQSVVVSNPWLIVRLMFCEFRAIVLDCILLYQTVCPWGSGHVDSRNPRN